jgi:hypothetical protein
MAVLAPIGSMSMQEIRIVAVSEEGENCIKRFEVPALSVMTVPVEQDDDAPLVLEPEFGVPEPISVKLMPDGATRFDVHVALPEGMFTVSPLTTVCDPVPPPDK